MHPKAPNSAGARIALSTDAGRRLPTTLTHSSPAGRLAARRFHGINTGGLSQLAPSRLPTLANGSSATVLRWIGRTTRKACTIRSNGTATCRARYVVGQLRSALAISNLHPIGRPPRPMFGRCERASVRPFSARSPSDARSIEPGPEGVNARLASVDKFFVQPTTTVVAPPNLSVHKPTGNCASRYHSSPQMPCRRPRRAPAQSEYADCREAHGSHRDPLGSIDPSDSPLKERPATVINKVPLLSLICDECDIFAAARSGCP